VFEVPEAEYAVQREGLVCSGSMDVTCDWVKEWRRNLQAALS
jgi:hypothetical protein